MFAPIIAAVLKFLSGFNLFSGEKLAKLLFYGVLITAGLTVYHKVFSAPPQTINTGSVTYVSKPMQGFGCHIYKSVLGVTW